MLDRNTCNHLTVCKQMSSNNSFKSKVTYKLFVYKPHTYMHTYIYHHHHHHVVSLARISLTPSCHFSQSFIASGRSLWLHPISSHRCCMYVRAGRPTFARLYEGVHRSTSLISSSLLLQQCPTCLVRLNWIVFVMGGRWPYSWCLVGCYRQDLFNIARKDLASVWFGLVFMAYQQL